VHEPKVDFGAVSQSMLANSAPGSVRESALLETIARASLPWPPGVLTGPGDDMALLELSGRLMLAAVDQVIEGRHFLSSTPVDLIARKAIARNLSDAAAMAVKPVATLAACALPAAWSHAQAEALFDAMRRWANRFGCPLVGGDIGVQRGEGPLVLAVTILAEPWPESAALPARHAVAHRRRAREGDGVFVTGRLGGAFGDDGIGRHTRFEPRLGEARSLLGAVGSEALSMVDLSDGLGRDAALLVDDRHQVVIDAALLPCTPGCDWRRALGDGEDYELCFATAGRVPDTLPSLDGASTMVTRIGAVRARRASTDPACLVSTPEGSIDGATLGWEHRGDG